MLGEVDVLGLWNSVYLQKVLYYKLPFEKNQSKAILPLENLKKHTDMPLRYCQSWFYIIFLWTQKNINILDSLICVWFCFLIFRKNTLSLLFYKAKLKHTQTHTKKTTKKNILNKIIICLLVEGF